MAIPKKQKETEPAQNQAFLFMLREKKVAVFLLTFSFTKLKNAIVTTHDSVPGKAQS